jgi:hypothetical protein
MPLRLVNLDDLTWEDLTAEARSLIPARSPAWTNHNPSDPGITLVELFAYFSEGLMYELNRISSNNQLAFLRLIHGPGWKAKKSLADERLAAVLEMRQPHRAVTAEDFEKLTLAVNETLERSSQEGVARVKCIFRRNLENPDPAAQITEAPGHVSVVVVPTRHSRVSTELLRKVEHALEAARLLTTRIHVVRPRFVTLSVRITLVARHGTDPKALQDEACQRLEMFFDPIEGGFDGKGWPFGRSVYLSELYRMLDQVPGVDYVTRSMRPGTREEMDELVVASTEEARLRRNKQGELEAIELNSDELVNARIDGNDITVATA